MALPRVTVFESESRCGGLWQSKLSSASPSSSGPEGETDDDNNKEQDNNDNDNMTNEEQTIMPSRQLRAITTTGTSSSKLAPGLLSSSSSRTNQAAEGMYDGMWINGPKELFEFGDYTFDEHYAGTAMPSYLTRTQVLHYIHGATQDAIQYHIAHGNIKFNTEVTKVETYNITTTTTTDDREMFTIHTTAVVKKNSGKRNYKNNSIYDGFDKVVLATGVDQDPKIPKDIHEILTNNNKTDDSGIVAYTGQVLHSSETNQLTTAMNGIANKRFLLIGSKYSAEDLALSFIKRGADHIYITTRSNNASFPDPVMYTKSWPMNKVTILYNTEIKYVVAPRALQMGQRQQQQQQQQQNATDNNRNNNNNVVSGKNDDDYNDDDYTDDDYTDDDYNTDDYNHHMDHSSSNHDDNQNFVLHDMDAVIYCTGYNLDYKILPNTLRPTGYDQYTTNYYCDENDYCNYSDDDYEYDNEVLYNRHLITNPSMFFLHGHDYYYPLLELDVNAALIVKVLLQAVNDDDDDDDSYDDDGGGDNINSEKEFTSMIIKVGMAARKADHPAQALIAENEDAIGRNNYEAIIPTQRVRNNKIRSKSNDITRQKRDWHLSDQGKAFLHLCLDDKNSRINIGGNNNNNKRITGDDNDAVLLLDDSTTTTNQTFRDLHYDSYRSIYTGIQSKPFPKLWMDISDV